MKIALPEPRRDFSVPIRVELRRADGSVCQEFAVNLSPKGLCIHTREHLAVGDTIEVAFTLPPDGPHVDTPAAVVWTDRRDEDDAAAGRFWETGLHLEVDEATADALKVWASQPTDRRR
jgi:hypothetical protein